MFVFVSGRNVTFIRESTLDPVILPCEHYVRYDCVLSGVAVATLTTAALCELLHADWAFFVSPLVEHIDNMISVVVKANDVQINKKHFTNLTLQNIAANDNIKSTRERVTWGSGFFVVSYEIGEVRALNKDETSLSYTNCGEIVCV